jgi:hypothetical protein
MMIGFGGSPAQYACDLIPQGCDPNDVCRCSNVCIGCISRGLRQVECSLF